MCFIGRWRRQSLLQVRSMPVRLSWKWRLINLQELLASQCTSSCEYYFSIIFSQKSCRVKISVFVSEFDLNFIEQIICWTRNCLVIYKLSVFQTTKILMFIQLMPFFVFCVSLSRTNLHQSQNQTARNSWMHTVLAISNATSPQSHWCNRHQPNNPSIQKWFSYC